MPWSIQGAGGPGVWGRVAGRIVQHPGPTLMAGVVFFGGLAFAVLGLYRGRLRRHHQPAGGQRLGRRHRPAGQAFPAVVGQPDSLIFKFSTPVCTNPAPLAKITSELRASGLFNQVTGPLNPVGGITLTPAQYAGLCTARWGRRRSCRRRRPRQDRWAAGSRPRPTSCTGLTGNYVSPDGRTVQFSRAAAAAPGAGPRQHRGAQRGAGIRAATTSIGKSVGRGRLRGALARRPSLYDISPSRPAT